ncbi:hypothetical protein PMZ80_010165 [Knufia obscura]|uniref:Delta(24)-sterol reductase n=2 Tax=Knufia TaxID=430999 RepID=A0AAN8EP34_9EURO|nr:hypothetical protein PMZ80_010165 [Knufia obscura]KAK5952905.1 hypothetical protein OHC33_006026 [Knufia fluminis]
MEAHNTRVTTLSQRVQQFYKDGIPFRLYHGNTNSTRPSVRSLSTSLDLSHMNHVISIDTQNLTCLVEPNVAMDALVDATLEHDLIPPVIPEFPGITVGGSFAGTAGESSSFRHGFFDATVNWCDVILADGRVVRASKTEDKDLFEGMKGTFGTLGVGVLFEVKLLLASRYVELSYQAVNGSITEAKELIRDACRRPAGEVDFVDGIMFSRQNGVVVTGRFTNSNEDGLSVVTFHKPWDQWHYLHASGMMNDILSRHEYSSPKSPNIHRELVPLKSYLFRYDRGAFWTGRYAYSYFLTPFNRITRYILDHFMHTRIMYHALHRSGMMEQFIIQDMALPWLNIEKFYNWVDEKFQIYPQWLCPLVGDGAGGGLNPHGNRDEGLNGKEGMMLNIGVWGPSPGEPVATNRAIEEKLRELKGMKWLYAQTFYTEEEFWSIYDKQSYDELRAKYNATTLPNVYDKVGDSRKNRGNNLTGIWSLWPLAGIYGVLSCMKGGDYLRKGKD